MLKPIFKRQKTKRLKRTQVVEAGKCDGLVNIESGVLLHKLGIEDIERLTENLDVLSETPLKSHKPLEKPLTRSI